MENAIRLELNFKGYPAVKDTIESAGIVHPEICAVKINGSWHGPGEKIRPGDRVEVYPFFYLKNEPPGSGKLQPGLYPAFLVDGNLGKLVRRLRLLGFDTGYLKNAPDSMLAQCSAVEKRILLTRDKNLLKHKIVEFGYWVRNETAPEQTLEIVRRYSLLNQIKPFSICIRCNGKIIPVQKENVSDKILPVARELYTEFYICSTCNQIYWRGPHYDKMTAFIDFVRKSAEIGDS